MDVARVREIMQSPLKIEVEYKGVPVWIDGVDEQRNMARIHTQGDPGDTKIVAVDQLKER